MKILVALLLLAVPAAAQTIKSLGYNTTNGHVLYAGTNTLTFTNAFTFSTHTLAATVRTNLGLGFSALTNTNADDFRSAIGLPLAALTNTNAADFRSAIGLGFSALTNTNADDFRSALGLPLTALTNTNADDFRSAIGLPWSGLTNTDASTFQGALFADTNAAPTNTNAPTPDAWLDITVGTNTYKLPLWQ
jgi:hypothetical protein